MGEVSSSSPPLGLITSCFGLPRTQKDWPALTTQGQDCDTVLTTLAVPSSSLTATGMTNGWRESAQQSTGSDWNACWPLPRALPWNPPPPAVCPPAECSV